jgi:hypothetical protein
MPSESLPPTTHSITAPLGHAAPAAAADTGGAGAAAAAAAGDWLLAGCGVLAAVLAAAYAASTCSTSVAERGSLQWQQRQQQWIGALPVLCFVQIQQGAQNRNSTHHNRRSTASLGWIPSDEQQHDNSFCCCYLHFIICA